MLNDRVEWKKFEARNVGHETWLHCSGAYVQKRGDSWHLSDFRGLEISSGNLACLLDALDALIKVGRPIDNTKPIYHSTDDRVYGTKFVYCSQHLRVHETGWCTVSAIDKIPLLSETGEEAHKEWMIKKALMGLK